MKLTELRVDRLKQKLSKLELATMGTKNELQRQGIDIESPEFEEERNQRIRAPQPLPVSTLIRC